MIAPAPQAVYQTERYGNFTYTFTGLTSGLTYKVRLHFAEFYWTAVGQRRFNVFINGTQVLTNFDIIAAAGAPNKATIQEFMATASSGQIVIQFTTVTDNAKSSGIEILLPPPAAPLAGNNGPLCAGITLNLSASTVPGATYSWTGPNGFTSIESKPVIGGGQPPMRSGTYTVTATVGTCASAPGHNLGDREPAASPFRPSCPARNLTLAWPDGTTPIRDECYWPVGRCPRGVFALYEPDGPAAAVLPAQAVAIGVTVQAGPRTWLGLHLEVWRPAMSAPRCDSLRGFPPLVRAGGRIRAASAHSRDGSAGPPRTAPGFAGPARRRPAPPSRYRACQKAGTCWTQRPKALNRFSRPM